jgi:hypothetical protein
MASNNNNEGKINLTYLTLCLLINLDIIILLDEGEEDKFAFNAVVDEFEPTTLEPLKNKEFDPTRLFVPFVCSYDCHTALRSSLRSNFYTPVKQPTIASCQEKGILIFSIR